MTLWKTLNPEDVQGKNGPGRMVLDVSEEMGDGPDSGAVLLVDRPDWVRDPQTNEQVRVLAYFHAQSDLACPKCKAELGRPAVMVAESSQHEDAQWMMVPCPTDGFVWKLVSK